MYEEKCEVISLPAEKLETSKDLVSFIEKNKQQQQQTAETNPILTPENMLKRMKEEKWEIISLPPEEPETSDDL
ncbi:hypothetical protein BLA29_015234, partial [Euroglyphus maynei]